MSDAPNAKPNATDTVEKGESLWVGAWHRLRKNKMALAGGVFILLLAGLSFIGPFFLEGDYYTNTVLDDKLLAPGEKRLHRAEPTNGGSGFRVDDILEPVSSQSAKAAQLKVNSVTAEGAIISLEIVEPGDYSDEPPHPVALAYQISKSGPGQGATVRLTFTESYILGTDHLGRDQLGRIIKGGQISLMVGMVATFVSLTIGIGYGTISGYFGGKVDSVMMRLVDILYSLPFVIFVILLMVFAKDLGDSIDAWFKARGSEFSISGQWNMLLLFVAIGAVEWLTMARIVRGQVMSLRRQEFIEACISLGLPTRRIIFRHMVPNVLGPVIVYTTLTIPAVMLLEAFLSFLGLGVQPPTPSWGLLIKDGADRMREAWWMLVFPGALFAITLFSFNFVGDGLRDALDPKPSKD